MMNVPENELFSACLDGELTAAEQAEMERLLATSPAARQLLEELRALSSTLQSLPAHKLNEDLSQHVLRLAEQRTLSGQTESGPLSPDLVPSTGRWRALVGRLSRPRVWIWPAVAVSVAILMAVLLPEQGRRVAHLSAEKHVAMAPAPPRAAPAEEPSIGAATVAAREAASEKRSADEVAEADREHRYLAKRPASELSRREMLTKDAAAESPRSTAAPAGLMASPALPASGTPPARASGLVAGAGKGFAVAAGGSGKPAESKPAEVAARPMKSAKEGLAGGWRFAKDGPAGAARKSAEEVLIVRCDVTAESLAKGAFRQALARRQIRPAEPPARDRDELNRVAGQLPGIEAEKWGTEGRDASRAEPSDKRAAHLGTTIYLYAEATPAQLDAVLGDLRSQPAVVASLPSVSVVVSSLGYGAERPSFSGKAGPTIGKGGVAGKEGAVPQRAGNDSFQEAQTDELSQRARMNAQNQPSLAESAAGAAPGNAVQNVQSRAGVANAIVGGVAANQAQVSQSRTSFGVRQQRQGGGERGRRGDAETKDRQLGQKAAGAGMAGAGGGMADREEAQAKQQIEEAPSQVPAMPGMPAVQQAAPLQTPGGMPGAQPVPSRRLKAKSEAAPPVEQEGSRVEVPRRVVFVLRVLDAEQIAGEKTGNAKSGQAKAAVDAARVAPVEAKAGAPAKPAAAASPASPAKN